MNPILSFVMLDIVRNRILLIYTIFLGLFSWASFSLEDNNAKGMLTLLNIILMTVPLISILFSTIYIYNSSEFTELLLSHPVKRIKIWLSLWAGLSVSLCLAFIIGAGIPLFLFVSFNQAVLMNLVGIMISVIFVSIAALSAVWMHDKAKGIGVALLFWLYFVLFFDALVLFLLFQLADYPVEKFLVLMTALSPIDLARVLMILQTDASALLGYTGAIFRNFFGNQTGLYISFFLLSLWIVIPLSISTYIFNKKDL